MKKFILQIAIIVITILLFVRCGEYENGGIPAYVEIDSVEFHTTNPMLQGTDRYNITDVWVYVDNEFLGTYEIPAMFPILKSGYHDIVLRPGIKVNGMTGSRMYYPFYTKDTMRVNLEKEKILRFTDSLLPSFTYVPHATFGWKEDFEDYQSGLVKSTKSNTIVSIVDNDIVDPDYGGNACGHIQLNNSTTFFEVYTGDKLTEIPKQSGDVYLELDYKTDELVTIGLYAYYESQNIVQAPIIRLVPSDTWKKIYVFLSYTIQQYYSADYFRLYISGGSVVDSVTQQKDFYFDNLKIIY